VPVTKPELLGSAVGGLASGLFGSSGQKEAQREQQRNFRAALRELKVLQPLLERDFAGYMGGLERSGEELREGFTKSASAIAGQGQSAMRDIREQRTQNLGDIKQQLITSGVSGALYSNAVRGTSAQATRQLASVREMIAGLLGGLEERRGVTLGALEAKKGSAQMQHFQARSGIAGQMVGLRSQYQPVATSGAAGYGQFLGSLISLFQKEK
jgi:hypothetical protein